MRTALCMAIGLAVVVGVVPASFAQDSRVVDHGKSAGTGIEAGEGRRIRGSGAIRASLLLYRSAASRWVPSSWTASPFMYGGRPSERA